MFFRRMNKKLVGGITIVIGGVVILWCMPYWFLFIVIGIALIILGIFICNRCC